jgi:hypothetical protein
MMGVFITFKNCIASAGSEECISDFSVAPVQSELDAALTKITELNLASWCALLSPVLTEKADQDLLATWERDVRGKKRTVLMVNQAVDDSKLLSTSSLPAIVQMNTVAAQTRHMFSLLASCSKLVSDPVVGRGGRGWASLSLPLKFTLEKHLDPGSVPVASCLHIALQTVWALFICSS